MAKIGYIMVPSHYDHLEADKAWMNEYGCVQIIEESEENEKTRPLWKKLMLSIGRGDELVISKFSNALRGSRELAIFLEFCRVKVIRIISIRDRIDSRDKLFPETKASAILEMFGSLPDEALVLRKSAAHVTKLKQKMILSPDEMSKFKESKKEKEATIINMYMAGYPIDEIWRACGYKSRSSIFRVLNENNIKLNRGKHSGPIKKWSERKNPITPQHPMKKQDNK